MFDLTNPPCTFTRFDGDAPGPDGVEGWWSDDLIRGKRVIYFEGTGLQPGAASPLHGLGDLWADLFALPYKPFWNLTYRLHAGFLLWESKAWDLTYKLRDPSKPLVVMGHSLGAAIAVIYAMQYKETFPEAQVSCQPFALPTCVGGLSFRRSFRRAFPDTRNWCVGWDPMPRLWLAGLLILLWLINPTKTVRVKYDHQYKFELRHPLKSIKHFFETLIGDHLPASIVKHVPDVREAL